MKTWQGIFFFFLKHFQEPMDLLSQCIIPLRKQKKKILWSSDGDCIKYLLYALQLNAYNQMQ